MTENVDDDDEEPFWEQMTEKERITYIRKHGNQTILDGMKSIFGRNQWKPQKKQMWENQLDRGKKLVRGIVRKKRREEDSDL